MAAGKYSPSFASPVFWMRSMLALALLGCGGESLAQNTAPPPAPSAEVEAEGASEPTKEICFRARPAPACQYFGVTNFGLFFGLARSGQNVLQGEGKTRTNRLISEFGLMRNFGSHDAVGASWFFTMDDYGWSAGPTARYRRWFRGIQSLDLGAGTPLMGTDTSFYSMVSGPKRGSILALVRYSPVPWFGVAVRPEVVRHVDCAVPFTGCADPRLVLAPDRSRWITVPPDLRSVSTSRILAGIELGEKPGIAINIVLWGLFGLTALLLSGMDG